MTALVNREGRELASRVSNNEGWPELRREYKFPLVVDTSQTGDIVSGSAVITNIPSTASLAVGYGLIATGIPANTHIVSIDSATQVTLDYAATSSGTGVSLHFGKDQYDFPSDFQYLINRTGWDRSRKWELVGPVTAQEWQFLESGYPATGFLYRYRIMQGKIFYHPIPESVSNIAFEYYTNQWCTSASGVGQTQFAADDDVPLLQDFLLTLGLKWRFLAAKSLGYAQELRTYEDAVERAMARSGSGRDLSLDARAGFMRLVDLRNVTDSGYGS